MSAEGRLASQGPPLPQFQFSPRDSATSFCKYDLIFFCKVLLKNVKMPALWGPKHAMGGMCPLRSPPPWLRHCMDTTHLFIRFNSVSGSFDSTQLMTHTAFTRIDSNQLTTQNEFLKFYSNRLMTQKASKIFDSNQLTTQSLPDF